VSGPRLGTHVAATELVKGADVLPRRLDLRAQRLAFAVTSRLTEIFPVLGARLLDATLRPLLGSRALSALLSRRNRKLMRRVRAPRRFLVIPDIHIGDAVMTQSSLAALRDYFPDAEIDYVINRLVAPLVEGNPDATRVMPIFSGGQFPSDADVAALRGVIRDGHYDLCLNFGSFMEEGELVERGQPFVGFLSHAPTLVRNENDTGEINHFSYQYYRFVRGILGAVARPVRPERYPGVRTTYSDAVIEQTARIAVELGLDGRAPVIMVNPDGACRFTLLPFEGQASLLGRLAADTTPDTTILLGEGHSWPDIGRRLVEAVPPSLRTKFRIVPKSVPLAAYAALMDFADVFITGDTGPLHLAAARRYSRTGSHAFRNRTAVLSLFGATVPRMSGYDSSQPGYLPANQDAPSWCYQAGSPCRNITCLNKYFKTCRTVRCFERVDIAGLTDLVVAHLRRVAADTAVAGGLRVPERVAASRALPTT
jgi:ADP-heptose:LPS heptosyltransferase